MTTTTMNTTMKTMMNVDDEDGDDVDDDVDDDDGDDDGGDDDDADNDDDADDDDDDDNDDDDRITILSSQTRFGQPQPASRKLRPAAENKRKLLRTHSELSTNIRLLQTRFRCPSPRPESSAQWPRTTENILERQRFTNNVKSNLRKRRTPPESR